MISSGVPSHTSFVEGSTVQWKTRTATVGAQLIVSSMPLRTLKSPGSARMAFARSQNGISLPSPAKRGPQFLFDICRKRRGDNHMVGEEGSRTEGQNRDQPKDIKVLVVALIALNHETNYGSESKHIGCEDLLFEFDALREFSTNEVEIF